MSVDEELAQELHKPMIWKFQRKDVYASFKDNIWAADLVRIGSLFYKKWSVKHSLLCVIDVSTKYGWVKSLKDKKGK